MTDSHDTTNPSSRPGADDPGRLSDLDHVDELNRMKARLNGLCVAAGSCYGLGQDYAAGLHQLVLDITDAMGACVKAFEREHDARVADAMGGARG